MQAPINKKAGVKIFISEKTEFRKKNITRNVTRDKVKHLIIM